jgi:hypothetical protein
MCLLFNRKKVVSALSPFLAYPKIEFGGTKHVIHARTNHRYNHRRWHVQLADQQILFLGCYLQNMHVYYILFLFLLSKFYFIVIDDTARYKLTFMASDETVEARMFCFDSIVKRIVGKSCPSVVSSVTKTWLIPLELASIVSLKFTFAVVYNDVSFHDVDKELLIKSIILAHGRVRSLPTPQTFTPALLPATPEKSISPGNLIDSPSTVMARLSTSSSPGVSLPI